MTKKKAVTLNSITEIENKVKDLKLELAKEKGMLASKTKSTNPTKKAALKKQIARLLTKLNALKKKQKEVPKKATSKKEVPKKK
ncbi:MAG TPA: 50S ribosomal protein L29 [archaeon]|jgi:large subunit ribosomal protein L29|nr:50S ribosomal protein L29 [archaeon]HPV66404.1 50S ribosomal protein L29 [archaeon]